MEADWDEVAIISIPPPGPHGIPTPVTTFAFDTSQELLWTGNEFGRVTSFYGPELQKYTSFKAHTSSEGQVKQLLFCDKGVLSISAKSIHLCSRRGLTQWHLTNEAFKDLRCMSFASKGQHEILVAGCQDMMFKVDVEKGIISQTLPAEDNYTMMKRSAQYICAATHTGKVHVIDPGTLRVVKQWQAHQGWIGDMDARKDFLVTCGYASLHTNWPNVHASVYDLKTLMQLPPIPFSAGAAFVRMHPRMSTTSIVASKTGQLQVVDIMNTNMVNIRQVNLYAESFLTALEIAPSGEALAVTDNLGMIRLWGSPSKVRFTEYSNPTEFPDAVMPPPTIEWAPDTPLSSIGMPFYREQLFSAWPSHMIFEVGAPPPKIDPAILTNLKRAEIGGYAPNPKKTLRNQAQNTRTIGQAASALEAPKFLSEKAKELGSQDAGRRMSDVIETLGDLVMEGSTKKDVPVMYRNVEIKYSKFGVDDFDFEYYNRTDYSGLETHIANSYANALLQLYRFIPVIRNLALTHTATSCLFENCLLCELGFLIDMLEKASGQNCQATNFLKTFSGITHAASLGLLEDSSPNPPLCVMIQSLNRFLLDKFSADFRQISSQASRMEYALQTAAVATIRCAHCTSENMRPAAVMVHDLMYPHKASSRSPRSRPTFSQILKSSVERQDQNRGWCDRCKRYQQLNTRKSIRGVPAVLMINANINTADAKALWSQPNWLPSEIGIILEKGQFFCYEGEDLRIHQTRGVHPIMVYELVGVVADINSGENQKPHLVSVIDVAPSSPDESASTQWHLFNDFLVRQTAKEEALRFDQSWKLPSVLAYQIKTQSHMIDESWKETLDPSLLFRRWSPTQDSDPTAFRLLSPGQEDPRPGTLVAIDAEFVALQREEISIKADGTRETIRPSRLGLARVSVLRGWSPDQGLPFIDDYISMTEPVVDYLTAYSGIQPGDLDRATSRHTLVPLKVAYKKLWLLLNLGCVFVGHGLLKDFRTINIHIPKRQVVDTVDLFYISTYKRRLNLRFLAWILLKEEIQHDKSKGHDSVEDARTALRLWRKHEEFVDAGVLVETLEWIYKKGREVGYKAPGALKEEKERSEEEVRERESTTPASARKTGGLFNTHGSGFGGSPLRTRK